MIFGKPYEFAVFFDVFERSDFGKWKYGYFGFYIEDKLYPSVLSNYTLNINVPWMRDSCAEMVECKNDISLATGDVFESFVRVAHSHRELVAGDPRDLDLPSSEPIGVLLSPLETLDVGFFLFYCPVDEESECLIYSADWGKTANRYVLKRGYVKSVFEQLPDEVDI